MSRLVKDMYRQHGMFDPGLFGLRHDQLCGRLVVQNAGWYNQQGEYLGHGDLNLENLERIAQELGPDEVFVILAESSWRFEETVARKGGPIGDRFYMELGTSYVAKNCALVIIAGTIFSIADFSHLRSFKTCRIEHEHVASLLSAA